MPTGPHFNLETLSKSFLALSPQVVNATTLPSSGGQELGVDLRGFNGDVYVTCSVGALPAGAAITFALQDAPQDADGSVPETGDFSAVTDTASAACAVTFADTTDNTYKVMRVDRHLADRWVRIQCTNTHASAALCACTVMGTMPAYEDQSSERVGTALTVFK